uniref:MelC protein n=1 Tax=Melittangium lichenicola TaxID=45 RepID=Q70P97_9BACT|nr:MelC protein [Melittangium lichenicola]
MGVELKVEDEHLRVRAARNVITPELQRRIAANKAELLALCQQREAPERARRQHEPFPLTDIQQAYLIGRGTDFGIGGIACHMYNEIDARDVDVGRLSRAWQRLIDQHAMLRSVVLPSGEQRVLESVPAYSIPVLDLRGQSSAQVEEKLAAVRHEFSTRATPPGQWPTFALQASLLDEGRVRIHVDIDIMTADASAVLALQEEWRELYLEPEKVLAPVPVSFREHVLAELASHDTPAYRRAESYWFSRLADLPPAPVLPLATSPEHLVRPTFRRIGARLEPARWERLKERAAEAGLTRAGVLCSAFSDVLAAWGESARFCINLTVFRRLPIHPEINRLVGDFTSNVLLEVDGQGQTFTERAIRLRDQLARDLEHNEMSGVRVLREQSRRREGFGALMPVVFTSMLGLRSRKSDVSGLFSWLGQTNYTITQTPQVWLDCQLRDDDGALLFSWDYPEGLFPEGMIEDAFSAWGELIGRLADSTEAWNERSCVQLPAAQRARRESFNATAAAIPEARLDALFLAQAERMPERVAVIDHGRTLSYAQLREHASALASQLVTLGAKPDTLIAVVLEKGWRQAVAVLAIQLAGAAYLPVDPALPEDRRNLLLQEGQVKVALTEPRLAERLSWPEDVEVVVVADIARGAALPERRGSVTDLAYCIYTSGSTGRPKGVMIDHRSAANTVQDINSRFQVGPEDRVFALSSLGFDLSVYDIFGALAVGAAFVLPESEATKDPASWLNLLRTHRVSVWNSVPTLMEMLVDVAETRGERLPDSLRLVMMSGDWIPVTLPDRIRRLARGDIQIISLGGATEGSVWSILHPIGQVEPTARSIPYGRPMLNQRFYVLDDALASRPDYVPGELFIGGVGVARGYFRDDVRTAERFIVHPKTNERLYRTGDLGRFLPGGDIEFLGRKDFQVKVAGHRIELGEIEAALLRHPALREAVVAAPGERSARRLVAYVVVAEGQAVPSAESLQSFLGATLPQYMVPGIFVHLERLPLSSNGKVDRKALPEPAAPVSRSTALAPGQGGELLVKVTHLVAEVLRRPEVDPQDNLRQLGASSVELIKLASLLEQHLGSRPKLAEFLMLRNAGEIAAYYLARQPAEAPKEAAPATASAVASPAPQITLPLEALGEDEELRRRHLKRTSHRTFSSQPVDAKTLGRLVSNLRPLELDGKRKYQYGSAAGAYGVRLYLHVASGRVRGLDGGTYCHDPVRHALVRLSDTGALDLMLHAKGNRALAASAAFSFFFVCDRRVLAPIHGEKWRDYALLEAGLMAQLLEMRASDLDLGLCQVEAPRAEELRGVFQWEEEHTLLHALVGGGLEWEEGSL